MRSRYCPRPMSERSSIRPQRQAYLKRDFRNSAHTLSMTYYPRNDLQPCGHQTAEGPMTEYKLKEQICEIGRRLYNKGFAAANDGNITIRLNDKEVLCSPTMVSKGFMKPEDICKVDYDGKQLAGTKRRTSEVLLHLAADKTRPDIMAAVHCHPPHATA